MSFVSFDTHEYYKSLVAVGIEDRHAEAITTGLVRAHEMAGLATKTDVQMAQAQTDAKIDKLDAKIDKVASELDARIDKVVSELDARINKVASELDARIDRVASKLDARIETEIADVKSDIKVLKWMIGATFAASMAIFVRSFF